MQNREGYTLIELMIVVAIIGILSTVMATKVGALLTRSHEATTLGNLATLRSALGSYYALTEGKYPAFPPPWSQPAGYSDILKNALVPSYLNMIPAASPANHTSSSEVFHGWNMVDDGSGVEHGNGVGWLYDANPFDVDVYPESAFGMIRTACQHKSSKGLSWWTY